MTREEELEQYNLLRIEALEGKIKELNLAVEKLEGHLRDALDQGYQFKV